MNRDSIAVGRIRRRRVVCRSGAVCAAIIISVFAAGRAIAQVNQSPGWSDAQIDYDPSTGYLTWVNNYTGTGTGTTGTSTNPWLQTLSVYFAGNVGDPNGAPLVDQDTGNTPVGYYPLPSGTTDLSNYWSYTSGNDNPTGSELDWNAPVDPNTKSNRGSALPTGTYLLAALTPGLTAAAFGNAAQSGGTGNPIGTVYITDAIGDSDNLAVTILYSLPGENDWIGASGGLWSTSTNWSLSSGTSTHRVPLSADTATFGNQYGNLGVGTGGTVNISGTQSVGSLEFNCANSYTLQATPGTTGLLSLSKTATITIDAGLHTIAVPLALSGSLTVDAEGNGSAGLTISGSISGTSSLIKTGPGALWLSNTNNSYNGNTQILGGTLVAAGPGSLGASGTLSISNATVDFSNPGTFIRSIVLSGSGANTIQADSGVFKLSGVISGSGGLTKAGLGTLAISNAGNSYGGGTNVAAGTLQLQAATAVSSASALAIAAGATLDLNGYSPTLPSISGSGSSAGTVTNSSSTTSTLSPAYSGGTAGYAAAIQDGAGQIALNVPSGGLLTLSNSANTYSGGTTVSGTLSVAADGNLGASGGSVALTGGVLQATSGLTLNSSRAIALSGNAGIDVVAGQAMTVAGVVSGGGTLTKTDGGTLWLTGANTYSGGTVINGGTLAAAGDGCLGASGGSVTINNGTLQVGPGTSTRPLVVGSGYPALAVASGTLTEAGLVGASSANVNALAKTGAGTLVFTNINNNFNGLNLEAGTLLVNDPTGLALGQGNGLLSVSGGTLMGTGTILQPVTMNYGGDLMAGSANSMGTMTFQSGLKLNQGANSPTWTLKIDGVGDSDSLDFGQVPGANSSLSLSGTAALVITGTPLPSTTTGYTIITDAQLASGQTSLNLSKFVITAPLGFTAGFSQSQYYFNPNFPNGLDTVTLSFTSATAWSVSGTNNWSDIGSWSSSVPNYNNSPLAGCIAMLGAQGSGTVVLPGAGATTYVNTLVFANSSNSYTLTAGSGDSTLEFLPSAAKAGGGAIPEGAAYLEVVSGQHTIAANAQLDCALDVSMLDPAASMTFSGALSGSGSLVLSGSGTLILSGDNSYNGGTTVETGTLYLTGSGSLPADSTLTVGAGGTLDYDPSVLTMSPVEPAVAGAAATAVPEPGTLAMLAAGAIVCLAARSWRRRARRVATLLW